MKELFDSTKISALLGVVITALIGYALYSFVFAPYQETLAKLEQETIEKEKKAEKLRIIAAERPKVIALGAEIYADYLKALEYVPDEEALAQVLRDIETHAKSRNLTILKFDAMKSGNKSAAGQISERSLDAELTGNHLDMLSFLESVGKNKRLTEVRSLQAVTDPSTNREKLVFNLAAYYSAEKITVPDELRQKAVEIAQLRGISGNVSGDTNNLTIQTAKNTKGN